MADFVVDADPNEIFELTELLGEGSYGAVYKGINRHDSSEVAIKIIPAEEDMTNIKKEIGFLKQLNCDFVVGYFGCFVWEGELWIVMEFCAGGSVSDLVDAAAVSFSEPELRAILAYVVLGLNHLHTHNSIHRDVKSGNVLLTRDGKIKLADFGVSAQLTDTMSKRKTVIGTPFWMAPEVIQETSYDVRADIWSLGITAIEMAEGHPPLYNVHPMRAIFMIPMKPPPTLREPAKWTAEFVDFVRMCLVKDPEQRPRCNVLLDHPFLQSEVRRIRSSGRGSRLVADLVERHWDDICKLRAGGDAAAGDGEEGKDGTMKATPAAKPVAEAAKNAAASPKSTPVAMQATPPAATKPAAQAAAVVTTPANDDDGYTGGGGGTLVRKNVGVGASTRRLNTGTSVTPIPVTGQASQQPQAQPRSDLNNALSYFKSPSSPTASSSDSRGGNAKSAADNDRKATQANLDDKDIKRLDRASIDEINEQLLALNMQYQADTQQLEANFRSKKQILETALARLQGQAAVAAAKQK